MLIFAFHDDFMITGSFRFLGGVLVLYNLGKPYIHTHTQQAETQIYLGFLFLPSSPFFSIYFNISIKHPLSQKNHPTQPINSLSTQHESNKPDPFDLCTAYLSPAPLYILIHTHALSLSPPFSLSLPPSHENPLPNQQTSQPANQQPLPPPSLHSLPI